MIAAGEPDRRSSRRRDRFFLAYAESVSAVDFLVRTYGKSRPRQARPLLRQGADRRRGVQRRPRGRHGGLRRRLAEVRRRPADGPRRAAARARRAVAGRLDRAGRPAPALPRRQRPPPRRPRPPTPAVAGSPLPAGSPVATGGTDKWIDRARHRPRRGLRARGGRRDGRARRPEPRHAPGLTGPDERGPGHAVALVRRRELAGDPRPRPPRPGLPHHRAASTRRCRESSYTSQERPPLVETALGLQSQQDQLKQNLLDLRHADPGPGGRGQGSDAAVRAVNDDLARARICGGAHRAPRDWPRPPARGLQRADPAGRQPVRPAGHRGRRADRRGRALAGGRRGDRRQRRAGDRLVRPSSTSAARCSSTRRTSRRRTRSRPSARPTCTRRCRRRAVVPWTSSRRGPRRSASGSRSPQLADVTVPAYAGTVNLRYGRPAGASPTAGPSAGPSASAVP